MRAKQETRTFQTPQGKKEMTYREWLKSGPRIPPEFRDDFKKMRLAREFWDHGVLLERAIERVAKIRQIKENHKPIRSMR